MSLTKPLLMPGEGESLRRRSPADPSENVGDPELPHRCRQSQPEWLCVGPHHPEVSMLQTPSPDVSGHHHYHFTPKCFLAIHRGGQGTPVQSTSTRCGDEGWHEATTKTTIRADNEVEAHREANNYKASDAASATLKPSKWDVLPEEMHGDNSERDKDAAPLLVSSPINVEIPVPAAPVRKNHWCRVSTYAWLLLGYPVMAVVHSLACMLSWLLVFTIPVAKMNARMLHTILLLAPEDIQVHKLEKSNFAVGAVVNATFGSITEITFYITALLRGHRAGTRCYEEIVKAALTGTLLGCILFIPVSVFAPTLFSKTFGDMVCDSCSGVPGNATVPFTCKDCHYDTSQTVPHLVLSQIECILKLSTRPLVYTISVLLPAAYLIGLIFTLKTHSHIYDIHISDGQTGHAHGQYDQADTGTHCPPGCSVLMACCADLSTENIEPFLNYSISQYFIGVTLLAMVPELPEIVNGIQFALQNNISLRYGDDAHK
ncbi:unnamed protein product [Tetraodon nigroviridis]|uniref:(spotted green pufferfish) hypothetical protein n=1 Tax=Tetraodon nigroviridis TaxID=99883 RepID=Q4SQ55_TETNG|nr:unnamed protein product [Tetraodon nigroviridis]